MSPEVAALAEAFAVAIHEAVRLELLEEMRAFAGQRQKRAPRRRRPKLKRQRVKPPLAKVASKSVETRRLTKPSRRDTSSFAPSVEEAKEEVSAGLPPPHLSKDGHTRGCRRKTSGKCSPNCVPTAASIEAAKQEDLEDDEGAGAPQEDGLRAVSSDVAPAPGESAPIDPGSRLAEVTDEVMAEEMARREPAPMRRTRRYPPDEIAARGWRVVVIRIDGKPPRVALLTATPKEGFHDVQLSQGGNYRFVGRSHRILAVELIRDATEREAARGYVV